MNTPFIQSCCAKCVVRLLSVAKHTLVLAEEACWPMEVGRPVTRKPLVHGVTDKLSVGPCAPIAGGSCAIAPFTAATGKGIAVVLHGTTDRLFPGSCCPMPGGS